MAKEKKDKDGSNSSVQQVALAKPDRQMSRVRFSPCGKVLVAAGRDGTIRRWDLSATDKPVEVDPLATETEKKKKPPAKPAPIELPELPVVKGHDGWVTSIAFAPEGERLFSADSWGQLRAWPYAAKEPQPVWKIPAAHDGWIRQIAVSPDGKLLASCGMDKKIRLWATADGKKVQEFDQGEDTYSIAFHPDGKSLVAGDLKGVVKHWNLATGKAERQFDANTLYAYERLQEVGGVRSLAFDSDGKTLAVGGATALTGGFVQGTPTLVLFDWTTGKASQTLTLGDNRDVYIHELVFHRDGYFIGITSGQPGNGKYFFLRPGEENAFVQQKLPNCHSVALHPNGYRMAVASNAGISGQGNPGAGKRGEYPGNTSPINILDIAKPAA